MQNIQSNLPRRAKRNRSKRRNAGFSLLELVMTLTVGVILAAMAVPAVKSSVQYFSSAFRGVKRHRSNPVDALSRDFSTAAPTTSPSIRPQNTFQVASETNGGNSCAASFSNVGTAVPFAASAVGLNQNFTLQFKPSGYVQANTGTTTFTLTYGSTTKTLTVSTYGNINVTP